jgi:hypothetical protein
VEVQRGLGERAAARDRVQVAQLAELHARNLSRQLLSTDKSSH